MAQWYFIERKLKTTSNER